MKRKAGQPSSGAKTKETPASVNETKVRAAYKEILGRDADAGGLAEFSKYGDMGKVKRLLAMSPEARRRGIDATRYGAKLADPLSMDPERRKYYEKFVAFRQGPVFEDEVDLWSQHGGSSKFLEASLRGGIKKESVRAQDGSTLSVTTYTPLGLRILGDDINLRSGSNAGEIVILPDGVSFGAKNHKKIESVNGMTVYATTGNPTRGWLGSTGIKELEKWTPKEAFFALDMNTAGFGSSIVGGQRGQNESLKSYSKMTGTTERQAQQHLGYHQAVGKAVVTAATAAAASPAVAAFAAAGMEGLSGYSRHQLGQDVDWGGVMVDMGIAAGASYLGSSARVPTPYRAAGRFGIAAGASYRRGASVEDSLLSGALSAAVTTAPRWTGIAGQAAMDAYQGREMEDILTDAGMAAAVASAPRINGIDYGVGLSAAYAAYRKDPVGIANAAVTGAASRRAPDRPAGEGFTAKGNPGYVVAAPPPPPKPSVAPAPPPPPGPRAVVFAPPALQNVGGGAITRGSYE